MAEANLGRHRKKMAKLNLFLLIGCMIIIGLIGNVSATWWNDSFAYRKEINMTGSSISLNDFDVLINVTDTGKNNYDFSDIRFINGACSGVQTTELKYTRRFYYSSSSAMFEVNIPILHPGISNTSVCMYYSNSTLIATTSVKNIYQPDQTLMLHFDETPGNTSAENYVDGAFNCSILNPGTDNNNFSTGIVGNGFQIFGKADGQPGGGCNLAQLSRWDYNSNIAWQTWIKTSQNVGLAKSIFGIYTQGYFDFINGKMRFYDFNGAGPTLGTINVADENWHLVTVSIYANQTGVMYVDDNVDNIFSHTGGGLSDLPLIGSGVNSATLNGTLDELKMWNMSLSPEWINRSYMDVANNSLMYNFGAETNNSNSHFLLNGETYNASTYETSYETFGLNITLNVNETLLSSFFNYAGTSYQVNPTASGGNLIFTKAMDIPLVSTATDKPFKWILNLASEQQNTTANIQTVNPIIFTLCNGTYPIPFINFTFQDETNQTYINASLNPFTAIYYYLGSGTVQRNYVYTNISLNPSYGFCFSPFNKTLTTKINAVYSSSNYPARIWEQTLLLTNSTTNELLYLLSGSQGIYSSIQTVSSIASPIPGVSVTVERQFNGIWTVIGNQLGDSSGLVTFFLNPNYDHRFTASKTGYITTQVTIRPTQSIYSMVMSSGSTNMTYASEVEGVYYTKTPMSGLITPGLTNFTYNITSIKGNMVNCRFDLTYSNGTIIQTTATTCSSNAYLTMTYTFQPGDNIYGKYYVDMGAGYILLEGDGNWKAIATNASSFGTIARFLAQLSDRGAWGVVNDTKSCKRDTFNGDLRCTTYLTEADCNADINHYGECWWQQSDESMRWEYTVIVSLFLIIAILGSALNIMFSFDLYSPGYFLWILPVFFLMISIFAPMITTTTGVSSLGTPISILNYHQEGLLYIQGATFIPFFDNYIVAICALLIAFGVQLRVSRGGG